MTGRWWDFLMTGSPGHGRDLRHAAAAALPRICGCRKRDPRLLHPSLACAVIPSTPAGGRDIFIATHIFTQGEVFHIWPTSLWNMMSVYKWYYVSHSFLGYFLGQMPFWLAPWECWGWRHSWSVVWRGSKPRIQTPNMATVTLACYFVLPNG